MSKAHNGYFSADKKGLFKDTSGETQADDDTYKLIIQDGNREAYQSAAKYLAKIKHIYTAILNENEKWDMRFSELKLEFKKRSAFLEEVRHL
ncbi:MAG: hypothetical protein KKD38_10770 [Candidatus Delongbacteria bacterium]|nr:hypothetical protein [Candidatus Delongbacteria bacterium]MCG2760406.1 hypothetical protein [Candidatus Delongbacteria bacterium]